MHGKFVYLKNYINNFLLDDNIKLFTLSIDSH